MMSHDMACLSHHQHVLRNERSINLNPNAFHHLNAYLFVRVSRVPLKRGMAFSTSTKNPPLLKTRNITSQNSINWHQIPATPTPPSPRSQQHSPSTTNACNVDPRLLQKQISHQLPLQTTNQSNLDLQRNLSNETDV